MQTKRTNHLGLNPTPRKTEATSEGWSLFRCLDTFLDSPRENLTSVENARIPEIGALQQIRGLELGLKSQVA